MPIKEEQSTSRQHPVPQNVMDVEFKIVGDLTIRQLMYLFAGMIVVYSFYKSGLPTFWRYIFISFFSLLSIAVAFVPIQERGLDKWLMSFIKSMISPTQMIWRKTYSPPAYFLADYAQIIKNEIITLTPAKSRNKLDEYLGQLEESRAPMDIFEEQRLKGIENAYSTPYSSKLPQINITPESHLESLSPDAQETETITTTISEPEIIRPIQTKPLDNKEETKEKPEEKFKENNEKPVTQEQKQIQVRKEIAKDEIQSKHEVIEAMERKEIKIIPAGQIDRPMTSLPSDLRGEIKIKTTSRIPKTIVAMDIKNLKDQESSLEKKVQELLEITRKAKEQISSSDKKNQSGKDRLDVFSKKYMQLKEEKESLTTQLSKSTSSIVKMGNDKDKTNLETEIKTLQNQNEELNMHLASIQKELYQIKNPGMPTNSNTTTATTTKPTPSSKNHDPLPLTEANVVSGTVKDKNGQLVDNAVILIKDSGGDVIRALKSNQLGQFKTQSQLTNGKYTIEVIKGGEKFDIISIEATGQPISPLNLIANE